MTTKGNGKTIRWIRDHIDYPDDGWCLTWPFSRTRGYGTFTYMGKNYYAHRFMCELVNGPPPSSDHEAAHSCGNGDGGCTHPKHVSWKTQSENQLDCRDHGTQAKTTDGNRGRLTREDAEQIRLLKGIKLQWQIAEEYGVSESTVSDVWLNRTHYRAPKIKHWTSQDDEKIRDGIRRGLNFTQMAAEIGRPIKAVSCRAYRIGLHSGIAKH